MKPNIHPNYQEIQVTCSCGNKFITGSTLGKDLHIEVCSACHPFFTGKQKIVDTAGRVERFKDKFSRLTSPKTKSAADSPVATTAQAKKGAEPTASATASAAAASEVKTSAPAAKVKSSAAPKTQAQPAQAQAQAQGKGSKTSKPEKATKEAGKSTEKKKK